MAKIRKFSTRGRYRDDIGTTEISALAIGVEIGRLVDASLAANTKDTYRLGLQSFESFREEFKLNTIWPPPHSHVVLL